MDVNAQLEALRLKFIGDLPKRMTAIEDAYQEWQHSDSPVTLHELHRLTHSLTGAAATFGCNDVSDAARTLEVQLKALTQKELGLQGADINQINSLLSEIATKIDNATSSATP